MRQRHRKGIENNPFDEAFSERNRIGPTRKNLLIPKDDENRLNRRAIKGKESLKFLK